MATILLATSLHAQTDEALLKAVDDHYNHLNSLRTRYVESYKGMGITRFEYGTLTLRKPGLMRWTYDTPKGKVFILDGKYAWFYTPGDPQVQRISAKQMDDLRSPLRFLLGRTKLNKELDNIAVTRLRDQPNGYRIAGIPRGMAARVKELSLNVTADGLITGMKVVELDGATTEFTFSETAENIPTGDSDFTFTPPPGVTIVSGTPPI